MRAWQRVKAAAAAAGLLCLLRARQRAERLERSLADAERRQSDLRDEIERVRRALRRAESSAEERRELLRRFERSRRAEREWNRELRSQLQRLYDSRRREPPPEDVNALVLRATIELVQAEKGILLSREDADGDGALDVAVSHGFRHDPSDSAVAQRFAREVLASDQIVREDEPGEEIAARTPADEEIDSLVAIPVYIRDRFQGVILCANRPGGFEELHDDVLLAVGDQAGAVLHHRALRHEVREAHDAAVRALLEALEARDPRRYRTSVLLTSDAAALARDLELDDGQTDVLVCATLLRDVGYLAMPEGLPAHPRPLPPHERAFVELHPRLGFDVLGQLPALRDVAATVLYHHERYDGLGYPAGLAGEQIPKAARALAVLEAYAAMTSDQPFRRRRSPEEACAELLEHAGSQFDPEIAELLVEHVRREAAVAGDRVPDAVAESLPHDVLGEADGFAGPLVASSTDGLTLLGNRRALEQDMADAAHRDGTRTALVLIQLEDLAGVNRDRGYEAGDRLVQLAARNAQRAAAREGGRAYRSSGRRLAVLAPVPDGAAPSDLLGRITNEFAGGTSVRTALCVLEPGEEPGEALERARASLRELV